MQEEVFVLTVDYAIGAFRAMACGGWRGTTPGPSGGVRSSPRPGPTRTNLRLRPQQLRATAGTRTERARLGMRRGSRASLLRWAPASGVECGYAQVRMPTCHFSCKMRDLSKKRGRVDGRSWEEEGERPTLMKGSSQLAMDCGLAQVLYAHLEQRGCQARSVLRRSEDGKSTP